ncbi:MAG TPA: heparan-alpha-glucosaminide N-acetyltransferase domain-containing protein [Cyclobacteriaceae bacterium]|nr:heparan-alpha-glucosaminide N-acetyltransferase domain-containing protein [Cyclobacteriaceae bacterium]HMV07260.1 heparan-alpha-glucosaminide N-acetyltransferase domain-containing protein [Cyclobacteriaceae bacterium]HMV88575.1 heparan-alpha-glucosaminide N-acetyltransferase domain-containing protein [Cyclobacteriaceae bacterium]HMW99385.1 heparan-alpha-glucosaminide N-acetyltransferase domain-containing protein [Cyclobacteriaceae bacterium]HMX48826.1 heparan-alpha-glucosaminide N-acetyltran
MNTTITPPSRIQSLDLLRGLVMVLMAIDHVRVYSGLPAGGPEFGIFFTRWITHFCAPAFAFFAGTSAFLYGQKLNDYRKLATWLITRGILLIVLELTVIRFFWAFNISSDFMLAGVIWMLGWCMVLLAPFIRMKPKWAVITGSAIILFQSLFGLVPLLFPESAQPGFAKIWSFVYPPAVEGAYFQNFQILYSIVPWIGVMLAGYGFGAIFHLDEKKRNKLCLIIGLSMTLAFLVIGSLFLVLNPNPAPAPFIMKLLSQQKYPASTLFLLMTLGPMIALIPWAQRAKGRFSEILVVIGRVPFFYYLAHILVIHLSALAVQLILHGTIHSEWFVTAPYVFVEETYRWSLPLLYLVFILDVVMLYFLCRWYAGYKASHPEKGWLKYV